MLEQLSRATARMGGNLFQDDFMKKFAMGFVAVLSLLAIPAMASAQKLEPGKWTGTVLSPEGDLVETTYDVTMKGDTIGITVVAGPHGAFPFRDVKLADKTLTFWFQPGPRVECKLTKRDDDAFEGTCSDPGGGVAKMVMLPPKKG